MHAPRQGLLAALVVVAGAIAAVAPAGASAFFAWQVTDLPSWDTLNVRAYPSPRSRILVAYPNGALLSMTGRCTGGVGLEAINGWPAWQQRQAVRYVWCEAWIDPQGDGNFTSGWVYGRYISPATAT